MNALQIQGYPVFIPLETDTTLLTRIRPYALCRRMTFTGFFAATLMCFSSISSANAEDIYINAGGGVSGTWGADRGFVDGSTVNRGNIAIANTEDDRIYQTERYNLTEYRLQVPNGHYDVRLLFSENNPGVRAAGDRVFNVNAEGKTLKNIDIFKSAGGRHKAFFKDLNDVVVSDGILNIKFELVSRAKGPSINAIRVLSKSESPTPEPPAPTPEPPAPTSKYFKSNLKRCEYNVASLRTLAQWEALFRGTWETEHTRTYLPMSKSLDSWQFYNLAYAIDATTAMYEATGKREYLDRALLYVTNVIANAKPSTKLPSQFKDSYLGWVSQRADTKNQQTPLFESYMWRYVTRLLRVMNETGASRDSAYAAKYKSILDFSERNIFDKWYSRGPNSYIYRSRTHMASHWAYISSNLWLLTSDSARKAKYKQVFDNINYKLPNFKNTNGTPASLHGQMKPHPTVGSGAYFFQDQWGVAARPGSDQTHGGNTIAYIVDANQTGIGGWTQTDIDKLIVTLDDVLWKTPTTYAYYLDGSGKGSGWWNEGWVKLGRYCPSLQKQMETHAVGRGIQLYANGALNMKIIKDSQKK